MSNFLELVEDIGILPLVVLEDVADAVPLGEALVKGGIPIAEVTFRTDAAADVIEAMHKNVPELIVGAGTIHTVEQAKLAVEKGAEFIVTPGIVEEVVKWCTDNNITIVPGCITPSDIELAMKYDLGVVKFFPAEIYGGVKTLKALGGPFPKMKYLPSGGITDDLILDYLDLPTVAAVGGSFVLPKNLLSNKEWDKISDLCTHYIHKVLGLEIGHVGINTQNEDEAWSVANNLTDLFSVKTEEGPGNIFVGNNLIEVIKEPYYGTNGHIALNTNYINRAYKFFERRGVEYREDTKSFDKNGNIKVIYMTGEIGGFAFHLCQKD